MKLEKKHWIIIGIVIAIILVWYFFLRKNGRGINVLRPSVLPVKTGSSNLAPDQAELDKIKAEKTKEKMESAFRGGFRGGHRRWYGGHRRPWGWGGYPAYPVFYNDWYDEPIIIRSTSCPEGWIWMGAMIGCVKQPVQ